jgi:hypothetical protein
MVPERNITPGPANLVAAPAERVCHEAPLDLGWALVQADWSVRQGEPAGTSGVVRWCARRLQAGFAQLRRLACLVFRCGAELSTSGQ